MTNYFHSGSESYSHEGSRSRSNQEERNTIHCSLREERHTVQITSHRSAADAMEENKSQSARRKKSRSLADIPWKKEIKAEELNLDPIRNFILSQTQRGTKSKPSVPEQRWLFGYSDDLFSEESKEANEEPVCWQAEFEKLSHHCRSLNEQLVNQAEEFQLNHRKATNRISVLETEKQKMRRELDVRQQRLEKFNHMYEDMAEDMHELVVEKCRLEKSLERSRVLESWNSEATPSPRKNYTDFYSQTLNYGKIGGDAVPREEFLKVVQELNKERDANMEQINMLRQQLTNYDAENRQYMSDIIKLEKNNEQLKSEIKNKELDLLKKGEQIRQMNNQMEHNYEKLSKLQERNKIDEIEIKRSEMKNSKLLQRLKSMEQLNYNGATLTHRNLQERNNAEERTLAQQLANVSKGSSEVSALTEKLTESDSDSIANDNDSILSQCGGSVRRMWGRNSDTSLVARDSQHVDDPNQPLLFFHRRVSYEAEDEETAVHAPMMRRKRTFSDPLFQVMNANSQHDVTQSEVSNFSVGVGSSLTRRRLRGRTSQAANARIQFSGRRSSMLDPQPENDFWWEWRWFMSSSLVIITTIICLFNSQSMSSRHTRYRS